MPLTVFELVTATFAADGQELRKDWEQIRQVFSLKVNGELLRDITGANFLAAMTLLVTYYRRVASGDDERVAVSCKKRDILRLGLEDYKKHHDALITFFHRPTAKSRAFHESSGILLLIKRQSMQPQTVPSVVMRQVSTLALWQTKV